MATIKDVAKKAGVSIGVVSRAFNNYPDISEKTRQKIFEVAKELNYTPNIVAKNLSSKRQLTIGLISSGMLESGEKDSHISFEIFKGVYTASKENHYELAIYLIDSQEQKGKSYAKFCKERNIGGAILQGIRTDDPYFEELLDTNIPCVLIDIGVDKEHDLISAVSIDNIAASEEITTYLLERNHRDIVVMAGKKEAYVNNWRLQGVQKAFQKYGVPLQENNILYGEFSEKTAYLAAKKYLQNHIPSAFLCFSDLMAMGVLEAALEAGLKVPGDLSITGFDGLILTGYTNPPITTIKQNFFEIGRQAALAVQEMMEGKDTKRHIFVDYELIERDSVRIL